MNYEPVSLDRIKRFMKQAALIERYNEAIVMLKK